MYPFASAVVPVFLLLLFIYRKDKIQPEPKGRLLLTFFVGCLSVIPASLIETVLSPLAPEVPLLEEVFEGYVVAGVTEEFCKLALLILVVWRSPEFDEYFDGIVYAVFMSLGFACIENISYVVTSDDPSVIALLRGLLAVPAHFLFAVVMGYHLSLAKFDPAHRRRRLFFALLFPALLHGTYDALLMLGSALTLTNGEDITPGAASCGVLMMLFIAFDVMLWRRGLKRIKRMQELSKEQSFNREDPFKNFKWNS